MTKYYLMLALFFGLSAFFSASEMVFLSANRIRLENSAESGSKLAALALKVITNFDNTLSALLIGNNLSNFALSSITSVVAITLSGGSSRLTAAFAAVLTVFVIIFCEAIPKILAKQNANSLVIFLAIPVRIVTLVLLPFVLIVVGIVKIITFPLKGNEEITDEESAALELQTIIEIAEDENVLDEDRSELLQSALEFFDVSASEAMTARVDMAAVDIEDSLDEILKEIEDSPFSRLPVYKDSIDNIIGVLYQNHLLRAMLDNPNPDIKKLLVEPLYVYKTVKMPQLLSSLRAAQKHIAIVTDEYGGTLGIITMEDVLEQIVGEIWDETDEVEDEVVERAEGVFELDGDMVISDFLDLIDRDESEFPCESETIGGWTIERFGHFPKVGDSFKFDNLLVTVLEMDGHRVERLLVLESPTEE
ncbi:MAG: HlyC/CorC family transporter [Ruminococcaceae bacterium]|nr:HlyC/CorC family transporter [Oscillospiraceae bacterium]